VSKNASGFAYRERLLPGISFYIASLVIPVASYLICLAFSADIALYAALIIEVLLIALSVLASPSIRISEGLLKVRKASIPLELLGESEVISKADEFLERGRKLDPRAYVSFQVGVKTLIKVEIRDAADPTPYWLFATRNPLVLKKLLTK
jgi:hypothetical protein